MLDLSNLLSGRRGYRSLWQVDNKYPRFIAMKLYGVEIKKPHECGFRTSTQQQLLWQKSGRNVVVEIVDGAWLLAAALRFRRRRARAVGRGAAIRWFARTTA